MSNHQGTGAEGEAAVAAGIPSSAAQKQEKQEKQIEEDSKGFKSEDERQAALRFQEQCHLMLKWEEFTSQNPGRQSGVYYKNFVAIDHDTPFDFINKMFHKGKDADVLFNLNTSQMSLLVPQVRLFKIYIDPITKEEASVELPFDDFLSKQDVANIVKSNAGRGQGAGLKSFSWKTVGTSPANSYQFVADMSLHFQSIEDIFSTRIARTIQFGASKKNVEVRFSDLLFPQTQFRKSVKDGPRVWNPDYFAIKAIVGWKVMKPRGSPGFIPKKVIDVIERTQNSFVLSMVQHEIDVRDDGSVDLDIKFMTMSEMLISEPLSANILFPSPETKNEIEKLQERIDRLDFEIDNHVDISNNEEAQEVLAGGQTPVLASTGISIETDKKKAELEQTRLQLEKYDNSKKSQAYRRIVGSLYRNKLIYHTLVKKEFLDKRIKMQTRKISDDGATPEQIEQSRTLFTETKNAETSIGISDGSDNLLELNENSTDADFSRDVKNLRALDDSKLDSKRYKVIYFYFGDLMDVVLEGMFKKSLSKSDSFDNKRIKVLLGPLTFYDYGNLVDNNVVGKKSGVKNDIAEVDVHYTGKMSSVNLADIPISMRVFTNWFNEKIVSPGLESYTFQEFVTDAINDLVLRAIKTECYDFAPRQQAKLTYKTFSVPENRKRNQIFKQSTRVELKDLQDTPFISKGTRSLSGDVAMEQYVLIHASVDHPWELTGDYDIDKENGIFHLFFGNERGVVKKIKFKRADKPYIRAANIANNFNETQGSTKVLREVYNATVEMYGNNLFEVGNQVRLVPSLGGGNNSLRLIDKVEELGIGGYFMVLEREDRVESGLYQTDLSLVWTSPATGKIDIGDVKLPNSIRAKRTKKKVETTKAKSDEVKPSGGDIGQNTESSALDTLKSIVGFKKVGS